MDLSVESNVIKNKPKNKRLPPLVLPKEDFYSNKFKSRLMYLTASSHVFKWDNNSNTKKFCARNGFNCLFWSAMIVDNSIIPFVLQLFEDNIKLITDEEFEPTFGVTLNKTLNVSNCQLIANYFLLFALPAKSNTLYLHEWTKRRLQAFYSSIYTSENLEFDVRPELFVATKQRFYVYPNLVKSLTLFALNSYSERIRKDFSDDTLGPLFLQIKLAISYSGLQMFDKSFTFIGYNSPLFDLEVIKEDVKYIKAAQKVIVDKYGAESLPFARLLNYPEVEALNISNYPDLAFCAHFFYLKNSELWKNYRSKQFKTKTPIEELKRLTFTKIPFEILWENRGQNGLVSEEVKKILEMFKECQSLPQMNVNLSDDFDFDFE